MLIHTLMSSRSLQFTEIAFLTLPDPCQIPARSLVNPWQISSNSVAGPAIYLADLWQIPGPGITLADPWQIPG